MLFPRDMDMSRCAKSLMIEHQYFKTLFSKLCICSSALACPNNLVSRSCLSTPSCVDMTSELCFKTLWNLNAANDVNAVKCCFKMHPTHIV